MKCIDLRRHVAQQEDPQRLPAESRGHLNSCSPCRAWFRKLLQIERQVPALVTPPSRGKSAFVNKVLSGAVPVAQPATLQPLWNGNGRSAVKPDRNRGQRKLAFVTSLAAGLLIFAASFTALQWNPPDRPVGHSTAPTSDSKFAYLLSPVKDLPADATPRQRMETLFTVADQTHGVGRTLAAAPASGDDLIALASWYRQVLHFQLVTQADSLPLAQRQDVLNAIASKLDTISGDTEKVAESVSGRSAAQALRDIARDTRLTSKELRNRI